MRRRTIMKFALLITALTLAAVLAVAAPAASSGGSAPHSGSYLGVHIDELSQQTASRLHLSDASGALITYVDQDGPACKAGLKNNDVIVGFNGSKVQSPAQLQEMIRNTAAGQTVKLVVLRDSQNKDISVTLGAWPNAVAHARNLPPVPYMAFAPPSVKIPDIDVPSFTPLMSRHGMVVESLCPQMSDYFGVPHGQGVLVRSVEKGSPAEAAGLKAGDVIVKVNNENVHDMADWRRAMHARSGKVQVAVVRDKREQTLVLNLPESPDTSRFAPSDWPEFEEQMQKLRQQMEKLRPELERSQTEMLARLKPSEQEMEQMRREINDAMKNLTPQLQQEMQKFKQQMEQQKLDLQEMLKGFTTEHEF